MVVAHMEQAGREKLSCLFALGPSTKTKVCAASFESATFAAGMVLCCILGRLS